MKDITIRTEVVGLEFTLRRVNSECRLEVTLNGKQLATMYPEGYAYGCMHNVFEKKDEPGMNWFDTVLATVGKAIMPTPKERDQEPVTREYKKKLTRADAAKKVMIDLKAICDRKKDGGNTLTISEEVFQLLIDYRMEIEHFIISGV